MKLSPILFLSIAFLTLGNISFSQFPGCPSVDAGPDVSLDCSTPCVDLNAYPFEVGATNSYAVQSIPHTPPIAYNASGGNAVSVNVDDVWSGVINLPFDFCFYGQTYNQCTIGSNGSIKFGPSFANDYHPWSYSASVPSTDLVDAGDIFGPYHDIDPSVDGTIKWYLLGSAPCRIFVVSFNDLAHFSCTSLSSTHMMVLYETTNAIDVYVQNKSTCSSWNSGNTVIGIQNPTGTAGLAAPGRNTGNWTVTTPEGWRFLPNGAPIYSVEWLENSQVIGTSTTINVCPVETTTYTARVTYTSCNGQIIIEEDEVTITPSPSDLEAIIVNQSSSSCGLSDGSIEISGSGGSPGYTYSNDNVNYSSSGIFNGLSAGDYELFVKDQNGCISVVQATIIENSNIQINVVDLENISCFGLSDGSITVQTTNGTLPYNYSINSSSTTTSAIFTNLTQGSYNITVTDAGGCSTSLNTVITQPDALDISIVDTELETCNLNNGSASLDGIGGTGSYSYEINGIQQTSATFNNLSAGTYWAFINDENSCKDSVEVTINEESAPILTLVSANTICPGANNGIIEVVATSGMEPYNYSVNGGSTQSTGLFEGLSSQEYTFTVTDANNCSTSLTANTEIMPPPSIFSDDIGCNLLYQVEGTTSFDGGVWTASDTSVHFAASQFEDNPLIWVSTPGNYTITFTDNFCNISVTADLLFPPFAYTQVLDTTICLGSTYTIYALENSTVNDFTWNTGATGPSIDVTESGNYIVTGYNICHSHTDTATILVKVCDIEAPNIISLSSTVGNNIFFVQYEGVEKFTCTIVNRWGNKIYEYYDPAGGWDGRTEGGTIVEDGTYFYIIKAQFYGGEEVTKQGFVQVVH